MVTDLLKSPGGFLLTQDSMRDEHIQNPEYTMNFHTVC